MLKKDTTAHYVSVMFHQEESFLSSHTSILLITLYMTQDWDGPLTLIKRLVVRKNF